MTKPGPSCKLCKWTDSGISSFTTTKFTSGELDNSAHAGCRFCGYILKAATLWEPLQESQVLKFEQRAAEHRDRRLLPNGEPERTSILSREEPDTSLFRSGATWSVPAPKDGYKIEIYCPNGKERYRDLVQYSDIPQCPTSDETWDFIKRQFDDCSENHELCRQQNQSASALPKRLLRLDGSTAYLIDVPDGFSGRYVALSYCWGKAADHASSLKTTPNTLQRMQDGVLFSELATTLQDAIEVTLRLGMNMIWIDALCILQGDPTDWAEESQKMADIYSGAFLVIQAASCASVKDSFLRHDRDNLTLDEAQNIKARRLNAFGHHGKTGYRVDDPIDERAWTLQEKALSIRTLRYSTPEVQWNCLMERSCECGQPPTDDRHFFYNYHSLLSRFPDNPIDAWGVIVEDYSNRSLTYDNDIFPALSGLARSMAVEIKLQYVAGLWIGSSLLCLWWQSRGQPEAFPTEYIAPTFSWASTRRQAILPSIAFDRTHAKILSAECCPDSSDSFGRIRGASLEIQGQLIPALLDLNGSEEDLRLCESEIDHFIFHLDGPIVEIEVSPRVVTAQRDRSPVGSKTEMKNVPVHFLLLMSKNSGDYCEVHGLVLGRSSLGDGYERLGYARRWSRVDEFPWVEETTFQIF